MTKDQTVTRELTDVDEILSDIGGATLVVHNDDVNTFDWVIQSLVEICEHTPEQAEQCAILVHFKGRSDVKHGTRQKLKPMKNSLTDRGISATIEDEEN